MRTPEGEELVAAAERYVRSLDEEDRTRLGGDSIELSGPGGVKAKFTGKRLLGENTLFLLLIFALLYFGYVHHTSNEESLRKVYEALVENTYVISRPQDERERMNITMPESLRRKIRARE